MDDYRKTIVHECHQQYPKKDSCKNSKSDCGRAYDVRNQDVFNTNLRNSTALRREMKITTKGLTRSGELHTERREGGGNQYVHMHSRVKRSERVQVKASQGKQECDQRFLV